MSIEDGSEIQLKYGNVEYYLKCDHSSIADFFDKMRNFCKASIILLPLTNNSNFVVEAT